MKSTSVITMTSYDTGQKEVVLVFNKEVTYSDYWLILGNFTHDFPVWLNQDFFLKHHMIDPETNDVYRLETELIIEL